MLAGEDTDMSSHVEEAEELLDREEDDGVKLEPFNLAQERAEGVFDESGHYVENTKDDAEETDAWLGSEDGVQLLFTVSAPVIGTPVCTHLLKVMLIMRCVLSVYLGSS